jgi:hypothetical protein
MASGVAGACAGERSTTKGVWGVPMEDSLRPTQAERPAARANRIVAVLMDMGFIGLFMGRPPGL